MAFKWIRAVDLPRRTIVRTYNIPFNANSNSVYWQRFACDAMQFALFTRLIIRINFISIHTISIDARKIIIHQSYWFSAFSRLSNDTWAPQTVLDVSNQFERYYLARAIAQGSNHISLNGRLLSGLFLSSLALSLLVYCCHLSHYGVSLADSNVCWVAETTKLVPCFFPDEKIRYIKF